MKDNKKGCLDLRIDMEKRLKVLGLPQTDIDILEEIRYGRLDTRNWKC